MAATAFSLASKSKRHLLSSPRRPLTVPSLSRFFKTNAAPVYDSDDRDSDEDRRPDSVLFYVLDPFSTGSSLSQPPEMTFQCLNFPVSSAAAHKNWKSKQTADGLILRMDMPGLGKDDVKVSVEQNMLIVKGKGKNQSDESGDDEIGRSYSNRVDLSGKLYKTNAIKAEMKNGVLKVFVPKMKEEERTDVFHVSVE
ncbi:hypothetical protein OROGR_011225 [Orobanche gracilis]